MTSHPLAAMLGDNAPSVAAADAWARTLDNFLRGVGDPLAQIEVLLTEHPDFAMGHVLRSGIAVAAKDPTLLALVDEALSAAQRASVPWTAHERAHLAAARAWRCAEPVLAAERYAAVLREWPNDLLALRLAQSCYFFLGQWPALREVVDLVWHAWKADRPGFEYFLAMAAYACAENGEAHRAQMLGRRALEIEPAFPVAIHSVAHALFEANEHARGVLWMRHNESHWRADSRMIGHNAWHLAMFELNVGNQCRALAILDQDLLPAASASLGDAVDATALLWRLQLDGRAPGHRWKQLSDWWAAHGAPGFWAILDIHAAIAFNAAGDLERAHRHADAIARCSRGDTHAAEVARRVTVPTVHAIAAFAAGAYAMACASLRVLRPALGQCGGSHVQHEIFTRMLHYAQAMQQDPSASRRAEVVA
jgi:hypothetical protein